MTEDDFSFVFDVNAKGVYFTVQKALPYLNKPASIVLTSSVANGKG
jgi:NAD(P)-dependent dehydrogenase (short-subunit alcohol dehydrogenase family)